MEVPFSEIVVSFQSRPQLRTIIENSEGSSAIFRFSIKIFYFCFLPVGLICLDFFLKMSPRCVIYHNLLCRLIWIWINISGRTSWQDQALGWLGGRGGRRGRGGGRTAWGRGIGGWHSICWQSFKVLYSPCFLKLDFIFGWYASVNFEGLVMMG